MKILSQRDPKWSDIKLGKSNVAIGKYGCTTTCLSMVSDWFNIYKDPSQIAQTIDYTRDGLIIWTSLSNIGLKLDQRVYSFDDNSIDKALSNTDTCCILQVNGNHWVLALSKSLFGGYRIADPWFGDKSTTSRYDNHVTGIAIISKI